jgi:hypothetical protein
MSLAETFRPEAVEAYKSSIMKRCELAQANPKHGNCHAAAYYLLGVEPNEEYGLDGVCYVDNNVFEPTGNLNQAVLIAFGKVYEHKLSTVHLATSHPYDQTKVIHRDLEGYYQTRRPHHTLLTEIADMIQQFTVGGNPIQIEELERVKNRWCGSNYFQMYLFKFRPEYYEGLLVSL